MNKIFTLLTAFTLFTNFCFAQGNSAYTITTDLPINILSGNTTTITGLGDDNFTGPYPIGFSLNFFGNTYTSFYLGSNGLITFGSGSSSSVSSIPITSTPNNLIAFASTDQHPGRGTPTINYFVSGMAPNRILVVNYQNVQHYSFSSPTTSVQIQLFEGSNKIEIHNIQNQSNGATRTIGIENSNGTIGFSPAGMNNSSSINLTNKMIRFTTCATPPLPVISPATVPVLCSSRPNTTLTASCATGTIAWSTGATTASITVAPTQTTSYTATCSSDGCQSTTNTTVTVLETPAINPSGTNYICTGGTINLTASVNLSETNFQWLKNGSVITNSTGSSLSVNSSGSYTVRATKDGCNTTSAATTVNVNSTIPAAPVVSPNAGYTCPNSSIQLSASGCAGTVIWSNGQTGSSILYSPMQNFSTVSAACEINGCRSVQSNTYTNAIARVTISSPSTAICPGSTVTLSSTLTVSANVTYQWLSNGSPISGATGSTYSPSTAGNYSVRVNYASGCTTTSNVIELTVSDSISPIIYACGANANTRMSRIWDGGGPTLGQLSTSLLNDDGSFYLGGTHYFSSSLNYQAMFNKFDALGNLIFSKEYGSFQNESIKKILKSPDGNFLLGMSTTYMGNSSLIGSYHILKVDATGNQIYNKSFMGGEHPTYWNSINLQTVVSTEDGYLLAGDSNTPSGREKSENSKGDNDFWVVRVDENGTKIWDKTIGGLSYDYLKAAIKVSDGFILAGDSHSRGGGDKTDQNFGMRDYWVVKIDVNGNKVWDKTFGGIKNDELSSVVLNSDGTMVLVGSSESGISGNKTVDTKGEKDIWLVKISAEGVKVWEKSYGGSLSDYPAEASVLADGGLVIGATTASPQDGDRTDPMKGDYDSGDFWLLRLDASGNKLWDKNYGSGSFDHLLTIAKINDGDFLLIGSSSSTRGHDKTMYNSGAWFLKVKPCEELPLPLAINAGQSTRLVATGCPGAVTWANGATTAEITVNPSVATSYTVNCNSINSCITNATIQVNINCSSNFEVKTAGNNLNPILCSSSPSTTLQATGCNGNILWSTGATTTAITVNPTATGTYSATCSASSCTLVTKSIVVTYLAAPIISSATTAICTGSSVSLSANSNMADGSFQWYRNGSVIAGATALTYEATLAGTYTFRVTKNACQSTSNSLALTQTATIPKPTLAASKTFVCMNDNNITFTASGCSGTVNWYPGEPFNSDYVWMGPPSNSTRNVDVYNTTKFYISCTQNNCESVVSDTITIIRYSLPISATDNLVCDGGNGITLTAIPMPATNITKYEWSGPGFGATNNATAIATSAGGYNVNVTYANGCVMRNSFGLTNAGPLPNPIIKIAKNNISGPAIKSIDRRFGSSGDDVPSSIIKLSDASYLVGGTTNYGSSKSMDLSQDLRGSEDFWVIKVDSNLNKQWDKIYGTLSTDKLESIVNIPGQGALLVGSSGGNIDLAGGKTSPNKGFWDFWVLKIDQNGERIWDKTFGSEAYEDAKHAVVDDDGGFLIAGTTNSTIINDDISQSYTGLHDYWAIKIDALGNKMWDNRFGGTDYDFLKKTLKVDGGFLLAGTSSSPQSGNKSQALIGAYDIWLVKIDNMGNKVWDKAYGSIETDDFGSITNAKDGGYILTYLKSYSKIYTVVKIDVNGNIVWEKEILGGDSNEINRVLANDKGYLVLSSVSGNTNVTEVGRGNVDYWMIQLDNSGNRLWDRRFGGSSTDYSKDILIDNNDVVIAGYSYSQVSGDKTQPIRSTMSRPDYWLVKTSLREEVPQPASVNVGEAITLTANNCMGTITWSGGATGTGHTLVVSPTSAKSYTATCNAYGCSTSSTIQINMNCASDFAIRAKDNAGAVFTDPTVCSQSPTLRLEATGCTGAISWSNGATGSTTSVTTSTAGSYSATCTNTGCTPVTASIQLKTIDTPTISANGPVNFCIGGAVVLNATVTGSGYTYQWIRNGTAYTTPNQTLSFTANTSGSYQIRISKNGCSVTSSATVVNVNATIPAAPTFASANVYTCVNQAVTLVANGCAGVINWSNGTTGSTLTVTLATTASYTATCTVNTCTSPASQPINVLFGTVSIAGDATRLLCANNQAQLVASSIPSSTLFQWYNGETVVSGQTASTLNTNIGGVYTAKVVLQNGCTITSNPIQIKTVVVASQPILPILRSNLPKDTIVKIWDRVYGGTSYDGANKIIKTQDNNFLIVGSTYSDVGGNKTVANKGLLDYYLIKVDSSGNKIWEKSFGTSSYDEASDAVLTNDGNILVLGLSFNASGGDKTGTPLGDYDYWLIKIDNNGNKIWDKIYGTNEFESYATLLKTSDNNYLICGSRQTLSFSQSKYVAYKINEAGDLLWQKSYTGNGFDLLTSATTSSDGGYLFAGFSRSGQSGDKTAPQYGNGDIWLVKADANGNKLWDKSYGGSEGEAGVSVSQKSDGTIILAGISYSPASGNKTSGNYGQGDVWLVKADAAGNKTWEKNYGGTASEWIHSHVLTNNNTVIVAGRSGSPKSYDVSENKIGGQYDTDGWLIEIDLNSGNKVWDKKFGGLNEDEIKQILLTNDKYFFLGTSKSGQEGNKTNVNMGDTDYWLISALATNKTNTKPPQFLTPSQPITLIASNCQGNVTWSNGMSGATINVSPQVGTTYTATCRAFGCTSTSNITINISSCGSAVDLVVTENLTTGTSANPVVRMAQNKITANNSIGGPSANASVRYTSGNSIMLTPGFKVQAGSVFQTKISPGCK